MLIEDKATYSELDKREELILMPFTIGPNMCMVITGFSTEDDFIRVVIWDFNETIYGNISYDLEKALVYVMNPKYNHI
jgi:hypothetical protein